ncbi:hypothetical protein [Streptomyces sp. NPDC127084]|uniref:IS1096 element passenger TnpR family protein n=1 Tax=Streptomyces sp. NPDC127084 TaxID=3347133 RepID=UPI00365116CC
MEQPQTAEAGLHYPHCVDSAGTCPPEDCGGAPGYNDLKAILADPAHEEHHAMLEWRGLRSAAEFDPDRFAPDEANAAATPHGTLKGMKDSRPAMPPFAAHW